MEHLRNPEVADFRAADTPAGVQSKHLKAANCSDDRPGSTFSFTSMLSFPEMKLTTRPAAATDREFARHAHHQAYHDVVVRQFGKWDEALQDNFFAGDWAGAKVEILLWDGVPCGYASIEHHTDCIHVRELVLLPEYQQRGIGTSLLNVTIAQARERCVPVKLGVLRQNRAIGLYRRLGFVDCGRTETHTLMEWNSHTPPQAALPHRIAAGAIVIHERKILLVRYATAKGASFLAAPGGALEQDESVFDAAARETLEETGLRVAPRKVLCIEDLLCRHFKMCKIWILCDIVDGELRATEDARIEGITAAGWYARDALKDETVFPSIIADSDWSAFTTDNWQVVCLGLRRADF